MCVDGHLGLVWNNEKGYPVDFDVDSLSLCSGVKSPKIRVRVLEMVEQRERKTQKTKKLGATEMN